MTGTAGTGTAGTGDLRARVLSALVLGPLVLGALAAGDVWFFALVVVFAFAAVREWVRMVEPETEGLPRWTAYVALAVPFVLERTVGPMAGLLAAAPTGVVLAMAAGMMRARHPIVIGLGVPYVALGALSLVWLREQTGEGLVLTLFLLMAVWASDIAAYAAGRSIGGPRLWPSVSPRKTWAGLVGALVGAGVVGAVLAGGLGHSAAVAFSVGALLGLAGQAGDLFESAIKRHYRVKDTGRVIPGHGGILDRIDALLAAAPVMVLLQTSVAPLAGLAT